MRDDLCSNSPSTHYDCKLSILMIYVPTVVAALGVSESGALKDAFEKLKSDLANEAHQVRNLPTP